MRILLIRVPDYLTNTVTVAEFCSTPQYGTIKKLQVRSNNNGFLKAEVVWNPRATIQYKIPFYLTQPFTVFNEFSAFLQAYHCNRDLARFLHRVFVMLITFLC